MLGGPQRKLEGLQWGLEEPKMELNGPRKDFRFKSELGGPQKKQEELRWELREPWRASERAGRASATCEGLKGSGRAARKHPLIPDARKRRISWLAVPCLCSFIILMFVW